MGYACPVCEDPQADGRHLANHLAFTAMLGDEDHEAWLEDNAPGWSEMGERDLAALLADEVEETEFPQIFEDTAGGLEDPNESAAARSGALFDEGSPPHSHEHERDHDHENESDHALGHGTAGRSPTEPTDEEASAILEEAREMTREMLREEDSDGESEESDLDADDGDVEADDGGGDSDADNNE